MARAMGATLTGVQKLLEKIKIMTELWYCDITRRSDIVAEQERSHAIQGRNKVKWLPGQETSLGPPRSNLIFRKQIYCIEECTRDIAGTFRRLPQSFGAPRSDSAFR